MKDENNENFKARRVLKQIGDIVFVEKYLYTWDKMSGKLLKDFFWKTNTMFPFVSNQSLKHSTFCIKISSNIVFKNLSVFIKVVKDEKKFDIGSCIRSETENRLNFRGEYWNKGIIFKNELFNYLFLNVIFFNQNWNLFIYPCEIILLNWKYNSEIV